MCEENIIKTCIDYFDLDKNYTEIKEKLANIDVNMKQAIQNGSGIRILNQDFWECMISFIISANNHIPRIKGIIERLSTKYGNEIVWEGKSYYTFPSPEQLQGVTIEEYRKLGLGFRDKRVYEIVQKVINNEIDLTTLQNIQDLETIRQKLTQLPGIGEKVADCILLFSLKRFEVFPVDVWVTRVMNELYIKNEDEKKVNKEQIRTLARKMYGSTAGIAQQYLFYWRRG